MKHVALTLVVGALGVVVGLCIAEKFFALIAEADPANLSDDRYHPRHLAEDA